MKTPPVNCLQDPPQVTPLCASQKHKKPPAGTELQGSGPVSDTEDEGRAWKTSTKEVALLLSLLSEAPLQLGRPALCTWHFRGW